VHNKPWDKSSREIGAFGIDEDFEQHMSPDHSGPITPSLQDYEQLPRYKS
jgi:hypothetical protein